MPSRPSFIDSRSADGPLAERLQRLRAEPAEPTVIAALAPGVLIFESGGAERSRAEYESHHMKSDMAFLKQMQRSVTRRNETVQGDTAWIVTESRIHGRYKDSDIDLMSIETAVLERDMDGWKIVHLHWSSRERDSGVVES